MRFQSVWLSSLRKETSNTYTICFIGQLRTSDEVNACRSPKTINSHKWRYHFKQVPGKCYSDLRCYTLKLSPRWLSGKEPTCNAGDLGSIPGLGRSPGEGNGNPLQYPCLENPMDRETWWATVQGVARIRHDLVAKQLYFFVVVVPFPAGDKQL